ncbi:MAG: hypothetical protein F6J90_23210 [Moorea sp. SIOASIH]|uniref:hypothetical protein n=1 Tax=Moorena sp. SIOASIH TaxID=2607817 RepID=UPI0013B7CFC2|nr:hypothetical protein [Moorena sp. SIOASIH]NEO39086.1 hypothetical protein [Moorena sp. SIOASIH]
MLLSASDLERTKDKQNSFGDTTDNLGLSVVSLKPINKSRITSKLVKSMGRWKKGEEPC